ncbi:MAG: DUF434 domain-containing protein [Spirochaetota bacterium]
MKDLNKNFKDSIHDLVWLLDRCYPKKPSVQLVGDRYRLSSDERKILFRGIFNSDTAGKRQKKLTVLSELPGCGLIIDGHNVLRTLQSYLTGKTVFRAMDGFLRDISGFRTAHGFVRYAHRCAGLLIDFINNEAFGQNGCSLVTIYLDCPVSHSAELAGYLRQCLHQNHISARVQAVNNPDSVIVKETENMHEQVVATSDTAVLDKIEKAVDIPQWIITIVFKKEILDLQKLLTNR